MRLLLAMLLAGCANIDPMTVRMHVRSRSGDCHRFGEYALCAIETTPIPAVDGCSVVLDFEATPEFAGLCLPPEVMVVAQ